MQTLSTVNRKLILCLECSGEGQVEFIHHYGLTGMQTEVVRTCEVCDGDGEIEVDDEGKE